jgi:hypothetical protein
VRELSPGELRGTLGLQQKSGSALKERQISAHHEPAIEREIEIANSGTETPRLDGNLMAYRFGQSVFWHPPLSQDGLSAEIVFQHFAETATLCRL